MGTILMIVCLIFLGLLLWAAIGPLSFTEKLKKRMEKSGVFMKAALWIVGFVPARIAKLQLSRQERSKLDNTVERFIQSLTEAIEDAQKDSRAD